MSNKNHKFSAKGYYIALALCAAAIGVSGYFYFRDSGEQAVDISAAVTQEATLPAAVTKPMEQLQPEEPMDVPETATTPKAPMKTAAPLEGEPVAPYAMECLSYNETTRDWRTHAGMDLAAEAGTQVKAAADGEVYTVYEDETMGTTVVIRHEDGYATSYASLAQDVAVKVGDQVKLGQTIGTVGNSAMLESALGDHVCFQVTCNGKIIDPAEFLN